jgi:hypothetical protein
MRTSLLAGLALGCLAAPAVTQTGAPSLETALKAAKKQNKLVLVSIHQDR